MGALRRPTPDGSVPHSIKPQHNYKDGHDKMGKQNKKKMPGMVELCYFKLLVLVFNFFSK
jgi:hypothetical protein